MYFFYNIFIYSSSSFRIDTLWTQLLLVFSTDHFETMHTYSTWSVDVDAI